MPGPAPGTKNRYGEVWDGAQWNDPADAFLSSVTPPAAAPAAAADPADGSFAFRPGESTGAAMLRYGGEELKGVARSPIDALKGLLHLPGAVVKGWTQDIPALLRDPSLLREAPRAAVDAASDLAMHPTELGSQLGQVLIAKGAPAAAPAVGEAAARGGLAATRGALGATGRVASAVGRGVEAVGESAPIRHGSTWGAGAATLGGRPFSAAGLASAPYVLRGGGRLAQRVGSALSDLSGSEALASPEGAVSALQRRLNPPVAPTMRELMVRGADRFDAARRAARAQDAAAAAGSGLAPDLGEAVPVRMTEPVPQAEPGDFPPWQEPPGPPPPGPPPPAPSSLDALRQRTGTAWQAAAPAAPSFERTLPDVPDFAFEGAAGENPPGPAVNLGGRNQFGRTVPPGDIPAPANWVDDLIARSPREPVVDPHAIDVGDAMLPPEWGGLETPDLTAEGTAYQPGEIGPGVAAPGFAISPALNFEDVPASRSLTENLKARTTGRGRTAASDRGARGRFARKAAKPTTSKTMLDDLKASLRAAGKEPEE